MAGDKRKVLGFTLGELFDITKKAASISEYRGSLYETVTQDLGYKYGAGEEAEEPVELEPEEWEELKEYFFAVCRTKDGKNYIKYPEEYIEEINEEDEEFAELFEEDLPDTLCYTGECEIPNDICGEDEYVGSAHTHPQYPLSPSTPDIEHAIKQNEKITCISSDKKAICLLMDSEKGMNRAPHRTGDIEHHTCVEVEYGKNTEYGFATFEQAKICPPSFLDGVDEAYHGEVIDRIDMGMLVGACWKLHGDNILCQIGNELYSQTPDGKIHKLR